MDGTGLRKAELLSLRIQDVDFGSNNIFVRGGKVVKSPVDCLNLTITGPKQ